MSETTRGSGEDGAPINPYTLLGAVNASSDKVHTGWLIFIAIMSYLLVAVAGVTHKDLLASRDIPLPILQVGIEMTRFFLFAPVLVLLFHVGVMAQLVMLARTALEFDGALRILEATDRRTHPLRLELGNFFFVQAIAGPERSRVVGGLLHGLTWASLVLLPVVLLLYIQLVFLPYHHPIITWVHRFALVADIALLCLIGAFMLRPEESLGLALVRSLVARPLTLALTMLVLGVATLFSFLVATVPGERLDRLARSLFLGEAGRVALGDGPAAHGFVLPVVGRVVDGRLFGVFERNLNVTDLDLVIDRDVTAGEPSLNLRRRDLRHARLDRTDLHQADLTGANLDGASLVGADLRGIAIHCADVARLQLGADRKAAVCPSARGADFSQARLGEANLAGLDLAGARLEEADLAGANLALANLAGANFYNARLERADLTGGVVLLGANLAAAALQGADLTGARLQGADLANAGLQGAVLDYASLHGASLRNAELEGASLYQARLAGADLTGANARASSFREAWIWRALPPVRGSVGLADLEGLRATGPSKAELDALEISLAQVGAGDLVQRQRERLAAVFKADATVPPTPSWSEIVEASRTIDLELRGGVITSSSGPTGSVPPAGSSGAVVAGLGAVADSGQPGAGRSGGDRATRLTRYLASLACKSRWANGSVATGLARRAQAAAFNGDMAVLYERLIAPECTAAKAIPAAVLRRLAESVDRLRGN